MNITRFSTITIIFLSLFFFLTACSYKRSKEKFSQEVSIAASDKVISQEELSKLDASLNKILSKTHKGVKIGRQEISGHDDLVEFLAGNKKCKVEGITSEGPKKIDEFYILMENSISVKGYIGKGNPDFAAPILALFECGDDDTEFNTAYIGSVNNSKDVEFFEISNEDFLSNITNGKFVTGISSPLDEMISKSVDKILEDKDGDDDAEESELADDVFCFITDGILSGSNAEIAHNKNFTINNLPLLEKRIRDAVSKAKDNNLHCLVYRLETQFDGVYFDYMNCRHTIKGIRPYYMILVGAESNLVNIENKLSKETNFTNSSPRRFASYDVSLLKTLTKAQLKRIAGQNAVVKGKIVEFDPSKAKTEPVVFSIQMNLNSLPEYYLNVSDLSNDLELVYTDKVSGVEVKLPASEWLDDIDSDETTGTYNFVVSLDPEYLNKMALKGDVRLCLRGHMDDWYEKFSSKDDSHISSGDINTFALDKFMGGIMKGFGYESQSSIPDAICYTFTVKRSGKK